MICFGIIFYISIKGVGIKFFHILFVILLKLHVPCKIITFCVKEYDIMNTTKMFRTFSYVDSTTIYDQIRIYTLICTNNFKYIILCSTFQETPRLLFCRSSKSALLHQKLICLSMSIINVPPGKKNGTHISYCLLFDSFNNSNYLI